ncbi:hypothetical protein AWC38_SpisGene12964 [Stylophora pistillata]|uniref:Endonuclease/exonuclease/phosphatase domain-containing protein n=1 Tax=Stylophora pistillata TaxID=50429 RepID=A0A2B4RY24_STYPI|nr:hypothetical protein AWC38_SpisGene12964 [Stylophora pistillata]
MVIRFCLPVAELRGTYSIVTYAELILHDSHLLNFKQSDIASSLLIVGFGISCRHKFVELRGSSPSPTPPGEKLFRILSVTLEEKNSSENGLLSRISMVRLRPKRNPEADILAVSYHGTYKKTKEVRHSACKILLAFLDKVLEKNNISSYIIGGDFNFDTLEFELPSDVTVASYEMSPRLQEKQEKSSRFIPHKDNFIWFSKKVLKVSWSGPISFEDKNNLNSDLTEEDPEKVQEATNKKGTEAAEATDMFDHDPVVGFLIHSSPSKAVKNLSEEFKDMSLSDTSEGEKAHPATEKPTYGCFLS